jgi:hypothetical protein
VKPSARVAVPHPQVHFWALPKTGDRADAFVPVEFSEGYEKTLLGHPEYNVRGAPAVL